MENWGLVVYLETGLLFDEETGSTKDKQNVSMCMFRLIPS